MIWRPRNIPRKESKIANYYQILLSRINLLVLGFCPTSKELANARVNQLADSLKMVDENGKTKDKETLTNLMCWEHRKLSFWRHRFRPVSFFYLLSGSTLALILFFFYFSIALSGNPLASNFIQILRNISVIFTILAGATFLVVSGLFAKSGIHVKDIYKGFYFSIPLEMILDYNRAICRDYAKLTACLLRRMYPEQDIYFMKSPDHVACGIKINQALYILDQKLPILTIHQWDKRETGQKSAFQLGKKRLQLVNYDALVSQFVKGKTDSIEELNHQIALLLGTSEIQPETDVQPVNLQPTWIKGSILYEMNDEIVTYSLAVRLRTILGEKNIQLNKGLFIKSEKDKIDEKNLAFKYFKV